MTSRLDGARVRRQLRRIGISDHHDVSPWIASVLAVTLAIDAARDLARLQALLADDPERVRLMRLAAGALGTVRDAVAALADDPLPDRLERLDRILFEASVNEEER
jgi:hypothetical protein